MLHAATRLQSLLGCECVVQSRREDGRNRHRPGEWVSFYASVIFVVVISGIGVYRGASVAVVYLLSFWHYYIYFLASVFAAVTLPVLKRDAILMKTVALALLFHAYFATSVVALSLAVVAGGFALNAAGALALGSDRTYYGAEIAKLQYRRVTAFPYSILSHPMLVGNIIAYGALLINVDFCRRWWPLVCTHIVLNLGLLALEKYVGSKKAEDLQVGAHFVNCHHAFIIIGIVVASGVGIWTLATGPVTGATDVALFAGVAAVYAGMMYVCYRPG